MISKYHQFLYEDVLWAKKSDKDGIFKWLPLKQHLIDVTEVIKLLWEHWVSAHQRKQILNSLSEATDEIAKDLLGFLAAIHDIGKATPIFQSTPSFYQSSTLDEELLDKLEGAGFAEITHFFDSLMNRRSTHHSIAGQALIESFGVKGDISSIVGAHHGSPVAEKKLILSQLISYTNNYFQNHDRNDPIHRKWAETQKSIFNWALKINNFESVEDLPSIAQPGQVLLNGLLIMADWIASNESYFPLISLDTTSVGNLDKRKEEGWVKWHQTCPRIEEEHSDVFQGYLERFEYKPRDFQSKLFEVIQATIEPGIFIVEAPMGVGKTEAALIGVEQLSAKTKASGMFFGLPTQATSNGIFVRIKDWLEKLDQEKKSLQLVHAKSELNDSFISLPRSNTYGESDENVIVNQWFTGRKTAILDDFIVGTVDHFLMVALKQKHLALRHLGFSKKVVVIDEVHAYDAYMNQYLYQALRWMGAYNVPVLILSATLPAKTRSSLVENYMRGSGIKFGTAEKPKDWETTQAYPLVTYTDGEVVKQYNDIEVESNSRIRVLKLEEEDLIQTIDDELKGGGIAGVIVNTVKRAQEIAETCSFYFGEELVELLHSNFIATDRIRKEENLLQIIGKEAKRPAKRIIIGTQVIEQSLDIDFDVLFSDLAPIDLLIQRLGRQHRHSLENRPKKLIEPKVFVMGTSPTLDFEKGSRAIYGDYLLIRTQLLLPEIISLPQDISPLIQAVYGDDDGFITDESLKEKYKSAKVEHEAKIRRKETRAGGYILDKPNFRRDQSLIGWLDNEFVSDIEERCMAQVRDIQETIEVIALKKYGDGYTFFDQQYDLSNKIEDLNIQKKIARHTLRLPLQLSAYHNISSTISALEKFNCKYLSSWQESTWLKGMLGIIFDENNEFALNGFCLKYCQKQGLSYQKLVEGGGD